MNTFVIDEKLIKKYPNKYGLTTKSIKKLKILDWDKLKEHTWYNTAMKGNWWCHLEGCNLNGTADDFSEFWIGFNETNNKIDFHFSTCEGMCWYKFDKFYDEKEIEHKYDLYVQINAIRYLNMLLDNGILGIEREES